MQVLLCLVSDDKPARDMVNKAKGALVPKTFRDTPDVKAENPVFEVRAVAFGAQYSLEESILADLGRWDGVCLLTDDLERLPLRLRAACFVGRFERGLDQTQMISVAVRLLSNYFNVLAYMQKKGSMEALALPIENFDADEMRELVALFGESAVENLFVRNFTGLLAKLRARHQPRRPKGDDPQRYFQDDKEKHFDFGPENHGQFDTGEPHTPLCELSGNFRFGCKIPNFHHFNVMKAYKKKTWIKGDFPGCHGQNIHIPGQSHVNMFANDFHKPK